MSQLICLGYRDAVVSGIKKIPDISFAVHQCDRFTQENKELQETTMNRICRYLQGSMENDPVFNPPKKIVVYCHDDADFTGLWGHENPQVPICARS